MKVKTLSTQIDNPSKDAYKVAQEIEAWLQSNNEIRIISMAQAVIGNRGVLTTIIYE